MYGLCGVWTVWCVVCGLCGAWTVWCVDYVVYGLCGVWTVWCMDYVVYVLCGVWTYDLWTDLCIYKTFITRIKHLVQEKNTFICMIVQDKTNKLQKQELIKKNL